MKERKVGYETFHSNTNILSFNKMDDFIRFEDLHLVNVITENASEI